MNNNTEDFEKEPQEENEPMSYKLKWAIIGGIVTWLLMFAYDYAFDSYIHKKNMEEIDRANAEKIINKTAK